MEKKPKQILCSGCKKNPAIMHVRYGATHCEECKKKDEVISEAPRFATATMADRILSQQDHALGDIAQPWNPDGTPNKTFINANPDAVDDYFTKEELEQL